MNGWRGQALHVNLTTGSLQRQQLPTDLLTACIGGRGLGVRLLRDFIHLSTDAPDLPLIFAAGPLTGTFVPASDRIAVVSRSPLTGTVFDCSAGGRFARDLKAAGLDALIITGVSPQPVWLQLSGMSASLLPATKLWGSDVPTTLSNLAGHGSVATIGPAGENGVLYAGILFGQGNAAGRGGLGTIMGAKQLKVISVQGDQATAIADPSRLQKANRDILRLFRASPPLFGEFGLQAFGTATFVDLMAQRRMTPTNNFRATFSPTSHHYSGPALRHALRPTNGGCNGCPIACKQFSHSGEPLPEYHTLSHFGALNQIDDLLALLQASAGCYRLGLDPVSAAATLATAAEISGNPVLPAQLAPQLKAISQRKSEGELQALGARRLADALCRPETAMTVKSLELPAFDPRGAYGLALAYCTSGRGGCHTRGNPISHEILRRPVPTDRFSFTGKARMLCIAENAIAAIDSLAVCRYALFGASLEEYADALSAVTGHEYNVGALAGIGERIVLTERSYNQGNGFTCADDQLPERFFTSAGSSDDTMTIPALDRERFFAERRTYYHLRGLTDNGTFATPPVDLLP